MTKFTIEDLRDIAYRGSFNDLERDLALQLLANMEQEPIATLNSMTAENGGLPHGTIHFLRMPTEGERPGLLKLYAEPQLSQLALDLREVFESWAKSKCWDVRRGETGAYVSMCTHDGWTVVSACRDAILAAKGDCR